MAHSKPLFTPSQPQWRGCDAFKIELSKVTTPDSAAAAFSPSVSLTKNSCCYLQKKDVPLRKWDQAREKTKKEQLEREASQSVGLLCAQPQASSLKPGANTANIWQAGWAARAFTMSGCCRITCSRSIRCNGLLGSFKRSAGCFVISCSQSSFVKTFWFNVFFLLLNGA